MIDEDIMQVALDIHKKNVLEAKIKEAVQAINEVECAVNEKEVRLQILKQQVEDAQQELLDVVQAKQNFVSHRDIQTFRKEIKTKSSLVC